MVKMAADMEQLAQEKKQQEVSHFGGGPRGQDGGCQEKLSQELKQQHISLAVDKVNVVSQKRDCCKLFYLFIMMETRV